MKKLFSVVVFALLAYGYSYGVTPLLVNFISTPLPTAEWVYFCTSPSPAAEWIYFAAPYSYADIDVYVTYDSDNVDIQIESNTLCLSDIDIYITASASPVADWVYICETANPVAKWICITDKMAFADVSISFSSEAIDREIHNFQKNRQSDILYKPKLSDNEVRRFLIERYVSASLFNWLF